MKKCIFHIPNFVDQNRKSGSQIRPLKMLKAFQSLGYDIDIVMGYGSERKVQIEKIKEKIRSGVVYDFAYSESSTMPTLLTEKNHLPTYPFMDFGFFRFLRSHGVKIGLFYRDIYWLFPMYDKTVSPVKSFIAKRFYNYDVKQYARLLDILYLPSVRMKNYIPEIDHLHIEPLPPAMDLVEHLPTRQKQDSEFLKIFYVGGLGENYNLEMIFRVANQNDFIKFVVCCREAEWKENASIYEKYLNDRVTVVHKSGSELDAYLDEADIANIFINPAEYWKFAMPVKLFEYMQHLCPIITTRGTEVANFVYENDIGWVIDYDDEDLTKALHHIHTHRDEVVEKSENMIPALKENTWVARAQKVVEDMKKLRDLS